MGLRKKRSGINLVSCQLLISFGVFRNSFKVITSFFFKPVLFDVTSKLTILVCKSRARCYLFARLSFKSREEICSTCSVASKTFAGDDYENAVFEVSWKIEGLARRKVKIQRFSLREVDYKYLRFDFHQKTIAKSSTA